MEYHRIIYQFIENILNQKKFQPHKFLKDFFKIGKKMPEKEKNKRKQTKKKKPEETQENIPPLDFSSLVLPFFTQAVINLGLAKDPLTNKEEKNLELAKRSIGLLELLKKTTKGNLKPEEEKFLDACLHQLRTAYMEELDIIKL
jgi:hypothetical protein